jgi:hypothetical protein
MVYANLQRFESKAERLLFYPDEWDLIVDDENDRISELLILAKDRYNVQMSPIKVESIKRPSERKWKDTRGEDTTPHRICGIRGTKADHYSH